MRSFSYIHQYVKTLVKDAETLKEIWQLLVELCGLEELKKILEKKMRKMNETLEKGRTDENEKYYLLSKDKICDTYLRLSSIDEILPVSVHLNIFSFLEIDSFQWLPLISHSFRRICLSNPLLFKKVKYNYLIKNYNEKLKLSFNYVSSEILINVSSEPKTGQMDGPQNSMTQFAWNTMRSWNIDASHCSWVIPNSFFQEKPILLYRSLFAATSNNEWRWAVAFWKSYIKNGEKSLKDQILKLHPGRLYRNSAIRQTVSQIQMHNGKANDSIVDELENLGNEIFVGMNHGFIDYSTILPQKQIQAIKESEHNYLHQAQYLAHVIANIKNKQTTFEADLRDALAPSRQSDYFDVNNVRAKKSSTKMFRITICDYERTNFFALKSYSILSVCIFVIIVTYTYICICIYICYNVCVCVCVLKGIQIPQDKKTKALLKKAVKHLSAIVGLEEIINNEWLSNSTINKVIKRIQYLYDHVLCIRDRDILLCKCHQMTEFVITQPTDLLCQVDWSKVQIGDEFSQVCREGIDSLCNALQHILCGRFINFTYKDDDEENLVSLDFENNRNISHNNGWNIINILDDVDQNERRQLVSMLKKPFLHWRRDVVKYLFTKKKKNKQTNNTKNTKNK
ncbi:hypothetical protein RFI_12064 [Reticulomyxa filosa]|uniref:F-box domain-containing protein n=1 Tax=Reticulomyxa filosa TaxID=46433 RepID=X6NH68_RETFI|nr:hypothetical protein RFI_12064 [Reticulomyxa filosa]|eukprot:ETO25079.1 hypothetical protein RFI_12064 [Reticulomyxa filosa]